MIETTPEMDAAARELRRLKDADNVSPVDALNAFAKVYELEDRLIEVSDADFLISVFDRVELDEAFTRGLVDLCTLSYFETHHSVAQGAVKKLLFYGLKKRGFDVSKAERNY